MGQPSLRQASLRQASLRRLREFDIRPNRELGQNFLVDSNLLGVIDRAAELDRRDVVLEIGGGLGVLSEYLAERVAHVHVVEVDVRLRGALLDATAASDNVTVLWADVLELDLAGLRPAPGKLVANLPYGVAASALLRTIEELSGLRRWVAMVQREVGERLAARPAAGRRGPTRGAAARARASGRLYGATSVIAQLACEVSVLRALPRRAFYPVPRVDSVLVRMHRLGPAASPALRDLVHGAFAHRRKTLARSLALARGLDVEQVQAALTRLGHPADARAERLSPEEFKALAVMLPGTPLR